MRYRKFFIGEIYINNSGLEFEIIDYIKTPRETKRKIRFLKTGYTTEVTTHSITTGEIKDHLNPTVAGVGINDVENGTKHHLYPRWSSMIRRCYSKNDKAYSQYGGAGVTVCERWHKFSNYIDDISKKENYEKFEKEPKYWHLDKDIINKKQYSNETTVIVHEIDNLNEMNTRNMFKKKVLQYTKNGEFVKEYDSLSDASKSIGVSKSNLSSACIGRRKTCKGYIWKYK